MNRYIKLSLAVLLAFLFLSCKWHADIKGLIAKGFDTVDSGSITIEPSCTGHSNKRYIPTEKDITVTILLKNNYKKELTGTVVCKTDSLIEAAPNIKFSPDFTQGIITFKCKSDADASSSAPLGNELVFSVDIKEKDSKRDVYKNDITITCNNPPKAPTAGTYSITDDSFSFTPSTAASNDLASIKVEYKISGKEYSDSIDNITATNWTVPGVLNGQRIVKFKMIDKAGLQSEPSTEATGEIYFVNGFNLNTIELSLSEAKTKIIEKNASVAKLGEATVAPGETSYTIEWSVSDSSKVDISGDPIIVPSTYTNSDGFMATLTYRITPKYTGSKSGVYNTVQTGTCLLIVQNTSSITATIDGDGKILKTLDVNNATTLNMRLDSALSKITSIQPSDANSIINADRVKIMILPRKLENIAPEHFITKFTALEKFDKDTPNFKVKADSLYTKDDKLVWYPAKKSDNSIELDKAKGIYSYAFYKNTYVQKINFTKPLGTIPEKVITECSGLTAVRIEEFSSIRTDSIIGPEISLVLPQAEAFTVSVGTLAKFDVKAIYVYNEAQKARLQAYVASPTTLGIIDDVGCPTWP